MTTWCPEGSAASETFPIRLVLGCPFGDEIFAHSGAIYEETVPRLADRRDDPLVALGAHLDLAHSVGKAHIDWQTNRLGAVVGENGTYGH